MDIQKKLKKYGIKLDNKHIIAAVSGGPDSVCLLYLLNSLKDKLKLNLEVCHVNYKLRGLDSDEDEKLVKKICDNFAIKCHILVCDKLNLSAINENILRNIRYEFFEEVRIKTKADLIAVAHNADDQVETVIMKFLRGASIKGLGGMRINSGFIIRPLLNIWKKDILDFLNKNKIDFRIDKSNFQEIYTRNKIRNRLIPMLEREYNPNIKETIKRNSEIMRDLEDFISSYAGLALLNISKINKENGRGKVMEIRYKEWLLLNEGLKFEILRLAIEKICGKFADISYSQLSEAVNMLANKIPFGKKEILKGLSIQEKYDKITIRYLNQ